MQKKTSVSWLKRLILVNLLVILGAIGGRLAVILEWKIRYPFTVINSETLLTHRGERVYGSIGIVYLLGLFSFAVAQKLFILKLFDILALVFCLAKGLIGIGCHIAGHGCYGNPTTMPWGMDYSWGSMPALFPVHPIPLYNMIFHLPLFFILYRLYLKKEFEGQIAALFLGIMGFYHFSLELIRPGVLIYKSLTIAEAFYLSFVVISIPLYFYLRKNYSDHLVNA